MSAMKNGIFFNVTFNIPLSCFLLLLVVQNQTAYFLLEGVGDFMPVDLAPEDGAVVLAGAEAGVGLVAFGVGSTIGRVGGMIFLGAGEGLTSGILSPCLKTLTMTSTDSPPYLFSTHMVNLPESSKLTPLMVRLANFPESNEIKYWSPGSTSWSFLNQVICGFGSPHTVQVRLRVYQAQRRFNE